jgi:hypothetical protein
VVRRVALIVAVSSLLAILQLIHVRALLGDGPATFFPFDIRNGAVVVGDVTEQGTFEPIGRLRKAGLRQGDVLEAGYTVTGIGGRIDRLQVLFDVLYGSGPWGTMTFHVRRPSESGRRLTIVVPPRGRERATLFLLLGWTVFVPLFALTAALLLGLLKPEDTRAFVGSLMFLALAGWLTFDAVPLRPDGLCRSSPGRSSRPTRCICCSCGSF